MTKYKTQDNIKVCTKYKRQQNAIYSPLLLSFYEHIYLGPKQSLRHLSCFSSRCKDPISNHGHNILELYNISIQTRLTTSKTKRDIQYSKLVYELPHELPNDLRLGILGNKEMLGKAQIWVETYPSAQSPLQKLNFGNSSQKARKSRYQAFLALCSFTGFLYLIPNALPRLVGLKFSIPLKKLKGTLMQI